MSDLGAVLKESGLFHVYSCLSMSTGLDHVNTLIGCKCPLFSSGYAWILFLFLFSLSLLPFLPWHFCFLLNKSFKNYFGVPASVIEQHQQFDLLSMQQKTQKTKALSRIFVPSHGSHRVCWERTATRKRLVQLSGALVPAEC